MKASVVAAVTDPASSAATRWRAASRRVFDGADPDLFEGAIWVLTPTPETSDPVFATVASIVSGLGAEVVALSPERHDSLVAIVSHVPHLAAATLMTLADDRAEEHAALLRLAAGGFRDMTRIASGHPAIWPDICEENRVAIVDGLDDYLLGPAVRTLVADGDWQGLLTERACCAPQFAHGLPAGVSSWSCAFPCPPPGRARRGHVLAGELAVNILDVEIAHLSKAAAVCSCSSSPARAGVRSRAMTAGTTTRQAVR